ncbi:hypothetical protein CEP54_002783 [Fusarium duplospermum]|uniref:Uncharacterized protein n=1 Tax=Fusarium duplospermum TaxID=1325734 RepID=A0A428QSN2_9HYPO|nr:hypothetical protein CEP54_002783 [Fusarium duplospermum]
MPFDELHAKSGCRNDCGSRGCQRDLHIQLQSYPTTNLLQSIFIHSLPLSLDPTSSRTTLHFNLLSLRDEPWRLRGSETESQVQILRAQPQLDHEMRRRGNRKPSGPWGRLKPVEQDPLQSIGHPSKGDGRYAQGNA